MNKTTTTTGEEPRAWFGCLASYNEGRLIGKWFDLDGADADDIREMIASVVSKPGGEWFMADSENLPGFFGENPNPETLAEYIEAVEEADRNGVAGCIYRAVCDDIGEIVDPDYIRVYGDGEVRDAADVALALCESFGGLGEMMGWSQVSDEMETYFDWGKYGRDLLIGEFQIMEGCAVEIIR